MSVEVVVAIVSAAGVIVALFAVLITMRGVRDQLWLQTFAEYTRRYGQIVNELPSEARRPGGEFVFEALPQDEQGRILNIARSYLNLCSEEYFLHERGRIDEETWQIWREGMQQVLKAPWIQSTWQILQPEYRLRAFSSFIDECIRAAKADADELQLDPSRTQRSESRA